MNKIKHTKSIDLKTVSSSEFLVTSYWCIKKLGWDINYINTNGIIAKTPASINNWSEEISILVDDNKAFIKSECIENEVFDWGKNRKNIHQFIVELKKLSKTYSPTEIFDEYEKLSENFSHEKTNISIKAGKKSSLSLRKIAKLFIPRKDYKITPMLIYVNVLVYLFMIFTGVNYLYPNTTELFNFGGGYKPVILNGEWYRLVSMMFVHAGLFHLLANIVTLIFIGLLLEPYLGSKKFLIIYLVVGLTASTVSLWLNSEIVAVGASGAIFGLYGVFIALLTTKHLKKTFTKSFIISFSAFILYNLLNGVLVPGIDNAAHFGGIISGFLIGYMIIPSVKNFNNKRITNMNLAAISIIFLIFTITVYHSLPNNYTAEQRSPQYYIDQTYDNYLDEEVDYLFNFKKENNIDYYTFKRKTEKLINKHKNWSNKKEMEIYRELISSFQNMENMAVNASETKVVDNKKEALKNLKMKSRYYWKENLIILDSLDKIELPLEIEKMNDKLRTYCNYRLNATNLRIKSIEEDSDIYDERYNEYQAKIQKIIDEIQY